MPGRTDWAVHVALWVRGAEAITAAAVAQPDLATVYASDEAGRRRRGQRWCSSATAVPDLRRPVAEKLGYQPRPTGWAGAKAMAVLRGDSAA